MSSQSVSSVSSLLEQVKARAGHGPYHFARAYRIMPNGVQYGIFSELRFYPYLWAVYEALRTLGVSGAVAVMKCAQTGWTETALNLALWFMATKGEGVLYMLPTESQLGDFSQARITPILKNSPALQAAFSSADNVGLKLAFGQPMYLRGAKAKSKLREIPVGLLVRDEYEEMDKDGAAVATSRLGASRWKWTYDLSNPKFPSEKGIYGRFMMGTQEEIVITCPHCGLESPPVWPDSYSEKFPMTIVCPDCKTPLNLRERWDQKKMRWLANNPTEGRYRSFHMSQLISPTVKPWEIMQQWIEAQGKIAELQTFYNMVLGLPYAPEGSRITLELIKQLRRMDVMQPAHIGPCCMGVDVGATLHVVIRTMEGRTVWIGTCTFEILSRLMHTHNVAHCAIDIAPETRAAKAFAADFLGKVVLVRYKPSSTATGIDEAEEKDDDGGRLRKLNAARTEVLDKGMSRFLSMEEIMPEDTPAEFWRHVMALTRVVVEEDDKTYATWEKDGADHFAHAFCYSELVRQQGGLFATTQMFPPGITRRKSDGKETGHISGRKEEIDVDSLDLGEREGPFGNQRIGR